MLAPLPACLHLPPKPKKTEADGHTGAQACALVHAISANTAPHLVCLLQQVSQRYPLSFTTLFPT